jgi:PleD family two-component response regulator
MMSAGDPSARKEGEGFDRMVPREIFFQLLDMEVKRARRYQNFFCVLLLKLTQLSNQDAGARRADCYRRLSHLLKEEFRESDILGRLGENCIAALLPYGDAAAGEQTKSRFEGNLKYFDFPHEGYQVQVEQILFPMDGTSSSDLIQKVVHFGEA